MKFMKARTTKSAQTKATMKPMAITAHSLPLKWTPFLYSVNALAPTITGIAMKNENSAAAARLRPRIIAPMIVAADREVPGIRARVWKSPIAKASQREVMDIGDLRTLSAPQNRLDDDQHDSVEDEGDRNNKRSEQDPGDEIVQEISEHKGRYYPDEYPPPELPRPRSLLRSAREGPQSLPEEDDDRENGTKLNDDFECDDEMRVLRYLQKVLDDDEVPGAADRQKLGDPLDDPHNN